MIDVLWFQMQAVFWRFVSSSGHHPRSIDQGGAIARSPSEWRQSDLLFFFFFFCLITKETCQAYFIGADDNVKPREWSNLVQGHTRVIF